MKTLGYLLPCLLCLSLSLPSYSQCPPPGFPQPGNNCAQAPVLCNNLNGYCATINNNNSPQPFPGCGGQWILNNDEWFAFFAGTTSISIQIVPSNCNGNTPGLQGAIYAGCGPPWQVMDIQCSCTTNPFVLNSNNFVVGQIYTIVLDGCAGNVCDYTVNVLSGSTVPFPPANPGPVNGPVTVCQNSSSTYNIAPPLGATTYTWTLTPQLGTVTNNSNNASVSWGNTPGTTQLCVTSANFCSSNPTPSCTTITVQPVPTATLSGSGSLCPGQPANIPLSISFTGSPPWQFVYTLNGTPQPPIQTSSNPYTLNVNQPGTFALQSVSSITGNCPGTVSGSVQITEIKLEPTTTITSAVCGGSSGGIDLTPQGGTAPYQYNWSNGSTSQDISNVLAGSYSLTLTDATGCSKVFQYTVGSTTNNPSLSSTTTPSNCELANGSIDLSVSGGAQPFAYNWSNGASTQDLSNVTPGSYTVTVTGADGCTATASITLPNTNPPINISGTSTANTACDGNGTGQISVSASPSSPPGGGTYSFTWSNGATGASISNLLPGSYTVTVSGGGTCTAQATFTVDDQPNKPSVQLSPINSTCELSNGAVNLSVSGGLAPFTYSWSNGATTEDIENVQAGSYSVTVTGANGCTGTASTSVTNNNPPITISSNVNPNTTCNGGNGSISITISPASPPVGPAYNISWSNGSSATSLSNLTPGTYSVTVTTSGSCSQTASFTVPDQPSLPVLSANATPATCGQSNGSVNLSASGGATPYTYSWSNGGTNPGISNVPGGSYSVTVTGANGCTASTSVTVPDNPISFTVNSTIDPNTSCNPSSPNGSISLSVTPAGNYTFSWFNGSTASSLSNLAAGPYSVTVSAGGNCTQTLNLSVPNQPFLPLLSPNSTPSTCGQNNGSATIIVSNGIAPFTYNWSNGGNSNSIANVPSGNYFVTVTGANNCSATLNVNVGNNNPPITILGSPTGNNSCLSPNGSVNVTVQPNGNYSFTWSNGSTQEDISNLAPGNYSVTVTAGVSCSQTATFNVPDQTQLPLLSAATTPPFCSNPNGAITLNVTGGATPYSFLWSNGATTQNLGGLLPGTYSVTLTTAAGCTAATTVTLTSNSTQITLSGTPYPNSSCTSPNGSVELQIQPPSPPLGGNYNISWSNGSTGQNLANAAPGAYVVTVSAGPSCTQTANFTVANVAFPPTLSTSATAATCGQANGAIDLSVDGGSSPFQYFWANGNFSQDLANLTPGLYSVTVTDANNCTAATSASIVNNNLVLNISGSPAPNTSCTAPNGAIDISVTPAGSYNYQWSNASTTQDLANLTAGSYSVTVSAGGSCTANASFTVGNQSSLPQVSASVTAAICGENNGGINLSVSGAAAPYSFSWSNSAGTEDLSGLLPGNYTVTVTAANGCTAAETINVPNNSSTFSISGTTQNLSSCLSANGLVNLSISPAGSYGISWSNGQTSEDISGLTPGTYTVTVTGTGSCSASASYIIEDETSFPSISQTLTAEVCGLANGGVDIGAAGGLPPYAFAWSNGATTQDLAGLQAGTYTVTVTGANGCASAASAIVPGNSISFTVNGVTSSNTSCAQVNGSVNLSISPAGTYSYAWSNNATTEDVSSLSGGNYSVTVSAGGNCTATADFLVGSTTLDPVLTESVTAATCGQSNGNIAVSVSGGEAPFSFLWSNNDTTASLDNLPPGDYGLQVTGGNGCVTASNLTVPNNNLIFAASADVTENTSCASPNGSIDLTVSPDGNYVYFWSNSAGSQDLDGLFPGQYSVTVTQGLTCTTTASYAVGNNTNAPDFSAALNSTLCGSGDGSIDLAVSGGTTPYAFAWSNSATSEDLSNLSAGNYSVTVTGADGCAATGTYQVQDDQIAFNIAGNTTANSLCGAANGAIDIQVFPAGNYNYAWSNSAVSEDLSGLAPGTYAVTVSFGSTCKGLGSFTVPNTAPTVLVSGTVSNVLCFGDDSGSIALAFSGGLPPYDIAWTPQVTDLQNLAAGNYAVVVTDASGCSGSASFAVQQPAAALQLACNQTVNVSLPGETDGAGAVAISGGLAPYTVSWSPGSTQSNVPAGVFPISNLGENNYAIQVTDANGCKSDCNLNISVNACITALGSMQNAALSVCGDECLTASYNPFGQYLDPDDVLQFILHQGSGNLITNEIARSSSPTFCFDPALMSYGANYYISAVAGNNDGAGNVLLTDDCTVVSAGTPVVFKEKPVASIAAPAPITCANTSSSLNAQSSINGSGFLWSSSPGGNFLTGLTVQNAVVSAAATYSLVVTAGNQCMDTAQVVVLDIRQDIQVAVAATPGELLDCTISSITLSGTVDGPAGLSLAWQLNGNPAGNGISLLVNAPGSYVLTATDLLSQCSASAQIEISDDSDFPPLFIDPAPVLNCKDTVVTLSGGSPIAGVVFQWALVSGPDTILIGSGTSTSVDAPGTYYLIGNALNGCRNEATVQVSANYATPAVNAGTDQVLDCVQTPVQLTGSTSPGATLRWAASDPGIIIPNPFATTISVNQAGVYTLVATSPTSFCTATDQVAVLQFENVPQGEIITEPPTCHGDRDGAIIVEADPAFGPYVYRLNGQSNGNNGVFQPLGAGTYQLQVTDSKGCEWTTEVYLEEPDQLLVDLGADLLLELGQEASIQALVNVPLSQLDTILWTPAELLPCEAMPCDVQEFIPLEQTRVSATVVDIYGCSASDNMALFIRKERGIFVPNVFSPDGDGTNDIFMVFAGKDVVKVKSFLVFSRWGEAVFEYHDFAPNDPSFGWDGNFRGSFLNTGVFAWHALVEFIDGESVLFKGDVTLFR